MSRSAKPAPTAVDADEMPSPPPSDLESTDEIIVVESVKSPAASQRGGRRGRGRGRGTTTAPRGRGGRRKAAGRDDAESESVANGEAESVAESEVESHQFSEPDEVLEVGGGVSSAIAAPKKRGGRPKGGKNKGKQSIEGTDETRVDVAPPMDDTAPATAPNEDTPKARRESKSIKSTKASTARPNEPQLSTSQPERPLSALDRFANLPSPHSSPPIPPTKLIKPIANHTTPPSAPALAPTATALRPLPVKSSAISEPVRPTAKLPRPRAKKSVLASTTLSRETIDRSILSGAKQARQVMADLSNGSPAPPLPPKDMTSQRATDVGVTGDLTETELGMTLEDFVRAEFSNRHDSMRSDGEAMIARWERAAKDARRRIEGI